MAFLIRRRGIAGAILAASLLAGGLYLADSNAHDANYLFINAPQAKDWAKHACQGETECLASIFDSQVDNFVQGIVHSMAIDPNCEGVTLEYVYPPYGQKHETLNVYYSPGKDQQFWDMGAAAGRGTPKEIAADACRSASGKGARLP
jgi:hypothetical protein